MTWDTKRLTGYIVAALFVLCAGLAFAGWGTLDKATGEFDLHPFNIYVLAASIAGFVTAFLALVTAAVANIMRWGNKK